MVYTRRRPGERGRLLASLVVGSVVALAVSMQPEERVQAILEVIYELAEKSGQEEFLQRVGECVSKNMSGPSAEDRSTTGA
jgi:hypothetical protein